MIKNDAAYSCGKVCVKRVQNEPSISFAPNETYA